MQLREMGLFGSADKSSEYTIAYTVDESLAILVTALLDENRMLKNRMNDLEEAFKDHTHVYEYSGPPGFGRTAPTRLKENEKEKI